MKRISYAIALLAFSLISGGCSEKPDAPAPVGGGGDTQEKEGYDIFLMIGQSNMAGRGTMIEGDEKVFDENVFLLDDKGEAVPATNPLNQFSSIRKDLSVQQIGPGFSFSQEITKATGRKVLLVVNARGGSSITEWAVGGEYYNEAIRRTKQAMEYGQLKAILWHQGESNSSSPDTYLDKLAPIADGLRQELGASFIPFIAGEIARWHQNEAKFNPVIRQISDRIQFSDYVSSEGCGQLKDDSDPHFSRDGQILLGKRYAEKVLEMCYDK